MDEIWKPVVGYENLYEVSSEGRIRSLDRSVNYADGRVLHYKEKILRQTNNNGYLRVRIKDKKYLVHRLVAQAFIPNPNNYDCINHKDEKTQNNNVDNLEWCDRDYNNKYGTRGERISRTNKGKLINCESTSKKTYQYTLDNQLVKVWDSTMECQRNGFYHEGVSACCRGKIKTYKGFRWSYTPLEAP